VLWMCRGWWEVGRVLGMEVGQVSLSNPLCLSLAGLPVSLGLTCSAVFTGQPGKPTTWASDWLIPPHLYTQVRPSGSFPALLSASCYYPKQKKIVPLSSHNALLFSPPGMLSLQIFTWLTFTHLARLCLTWQVSSEVTTLGNTPPHLLPSSG
jgi:hypothetical protein